MLHQARGLSSRELAAIAALEARTVAVDGGRLKLEWGVLRTRPGAAVEDLLWWDGDDLLGFLGLYAFGSPSAELAGMVDPAARRRGIGTALLDAALPLCHDRGYQSALLVTNRASHDAREFARARGAVLEHSEHALVLLGAPTDGPRDPRITLRPATAADTGEVVGLLRSAFGWSAADTTERSRDDLLQTVLVEYDGAAVGTMRVNRNDDVVGIYGFAVDPAWQGRGIGRDALRRVCQQARDDGAHRIGLEVAVENDHALGLYTSLGFTQLTTEDYYTMPTA